MKERIELACLDVTIGAAAVCLVLVLARLILGCVPPRPASGCVERQEPHRHALYSDDPECWKGDGGR